MESAPALTSQTQPRGITLVEMLVVLAIISVITTVAILGQSTFNRTLLLTNTAYNMAFSARQAQSYGLSSRKFNTTTNPGYGLHFDRATLGRYVMFADIRDTLNPDPTSCPTGVAGTPSAKPGNCRFDSTDGTVNTYTFSNGFSIARFCAKRINRTADCSDDRSQPLRNLDLVFTRPNTSTIISGQTSSGSSVTTYNCAMITIRDRTGQNTRDIRVSSLGEISVGSTLPCQ